MGYRKIHIIGGPGSGKSYAAGKISSACDIPSFDLDDIFWDRKSETYGKRADADERDKALAEILAHDAWIVEGVYHQWLARSFEEADLIVILSPPVAVRDWRIIRRFVSRRLGRAPSKRESLSDLWSLIKWNHTYDNDNLRRAREMIACHSGKTVECRSGDEAARVAIG